MANRKYRKLGDKDVVAQFMFVCVDPSTLTQKYLYKILQTTIQYEEERRGEQGHIEDFLAFVQGKKRVNAAALNVVSNTFSIDGEIAYLTREDVIGVLEDKIFHEMQSLRNPKFKSTHAPHFLTKKKLVVVVGHRLFLMDNLHLYLEHQGFLRPFTFQLVKELGSLEPPQKNSQEFDCLRLDVGETAIRGKSGFYPGNIEALGALVGVKTHASIDILTKEELLAKLGL